MEHYAIRFEPSGKEVTARHGERLIDVAFRAALPVGNACDREGICGRCGLRILSGAQNSPAETQAEVRTKAANRIDPALRLSCLLRIEGPMIVTADYW